MKKRLVSAAVTVALFIGLIAGVTFKASDKKEIKHFTAFFSVEGDNIDPDNDIKQLIAEQIGAECEETWLVGQDKDDAINSLIATGEYPDFVLGETALYEADALIPIDEYWDDYPNIKEYLSDEQWEKFRQPDGHIYWIPQFGVSHGDDVEMLHNGEAFWIQTRVLKWAGYPKITTIEQYFDLIESYVQANPTMPDGTENIPFTILCDDWRYFCLENVPQFLDGFPNDGSCMVDTETKKVMDYNVTDTAKRYFGKLNEEFHKGIMDPGAFNATYDQYLDKLSTGAVLGMVDQWWQFYYVIEPVFKKQNLLMDDLNKRLVEKEIKVELTDSAKKFITDNGYDPIYGARPLKRYLQKHVETLAAKLILGDGVRTGDTILIDEKDGQLSASTVPAAV